MTVAEPWWLYLDFDGVLNSDPFLRRQRNVLPQSEHRLFDVENLLALDSLCEALPVASIVITSTWREGRSVQLLQELLAGEGFRHGSLVSGVTPFGKTRAAEILSHARSHAVGRYFVLDDMNLHPLVPPVFFQTSAATGLTRDLVDRVLGTLQG